MSPFSTGSLQKLNMDLNMALPPFAFLPLGGTLAALGAAVAVPVVIHLLSRMRYRIVTWAAMRFLLAAKMQTARRLRIEQLLLLLVRTAIVACIVLAMASVTGWAEQWWQALAPGAAGFGGGRSGRTHTILVLDGSLSMGVSEPGGKTCFEKARDVATKVINEMQSGDGVSILLMKDAPVWIVGEASQDPRKLLKELNSIRQPHGNSSVPATLNALAAKLREASGRFDAREVLFLTDLQQTTWIPDLPSEGAVPDKDGAQAKVLREIQKRARTAFVDVGRDNVNNAAVTSLALNDPLVTTHSVATFRAQVKNFGNQIKEKLTVRLLVGRWPASSKEPELRLAMSEIRTLQPSEELAVNFTHKFTAPGVYVVQVAIDEDDLRLDDSRSVIVTVKDTIPILLVDGKSSINRFERAAEYLGIALNPFGKGPQAVLAPFRPKVVSTALFADANQTNLADYDCVFLCDVGPLASTEVRRLEANVRRGAGLVVTAGDNMAKHIESYNRLLYANDQGLLPAKLLGLQAASPDHWFALDSPDGFSLPPLKEFLNQDDRIALQAARFQQYVQTQAANDATVRKVLTFRPEALAGTKEKTEGALPLGDAAAIEWNPPARFDDKAGPKIDKDKAASAVRGVQRYRGKVLLLTTTVNMDWNSWPASPSYLAMMQELTRYGVGGLLREQSVLVGGVLEEFFPGGAELEGTLTLAGGEPPHKVKIVPGEDLSVFRWHDTDQAGLYRLTVGNDPHEYLFAVNVPATVPDHKSSESDLTRADKLKLASAYPTWNFQLVKELGQVQHGGSSAASETDPDKPAKPKPIGPWIAHFFLIAVIVLLFLELVLACCFGHYSATAAAFNQTSSRTLRFVTALGAGCAVVGLIGLVFIGIAVVEYAFSGDFLGFCMPDSFRGWVEGILDVPPPAPGESTKWTLREGAVLGTWPYYPMLADAVIGLAGITIVITSLFEARSGARGLYLAILGVLAFVNISVASTWLLLQPEVHFERQNWPDVVLLIDDSLSMGGVDPYRDEKMREPVERLAQRFKRYVLDNHPATIAALQKQLESRRKAVEAEGKNPVNDEDALRLERRIAGLQLLLTKVNSSGWKPTRLQLAQSILLGSKPDWLATLSKKNRLKIHVFHLDAEGRALKLHDETGAPADIVEPEDLERTERAVAALVPVGTDSRLGGALRQVIDYYRGAQLSGVIMFTDGVTTVDESLVQVSEYAAQKAVPLFFVGIGEDQETRDIELRDLQVEDPVFVNDKLIFEARITGAGYKDTTIPVVLKVKEGNKEKELSRENVKLDPTGKAVKVRLKHQPTEPGEKRYIVEAEVPKNLADELLPGPGKRRLERDIFVQDSKLIRVLFIEGSARYDYRFVKNLLERENPDKKSNKTIDVKVLLVDSDEDFPREDKSALAAFPQTRQELFQYDVVIIGDVDPRSVKLGEPRLRDLADFVKERGGGLLAVAGPQFMPHAYKDTPLAAVLPIEIGPPPIEPDERADGYNLDITPSGRMHPMFRFIPDEADNLALWKRLAPMYWWSENYRPKPLAEVLAVHPRVKADAKVGKGQDERYPLVLQQFVGPGRSMFFGFDESWRWRYREDELRFNQFWIQTIRYLARGKLARTELRLDRQSEYRVGEPIKVTVRFPDASVLRGGGKADAKMPPDAKVIITVEHRIKTAGAGEVEGSGEGEGPKTEIQTLQLAKVEGSWATYEGVLTQTHPGEYRFWLTQPDVAKQQPNGKKPSATAIVVRPPGEDQLRYNERELIQAGAASRSKEELAAAVSAGRKDPGYYTVATADQVLEDLSLETVAATGQLVPYTPRPPWPVWNLFLFSFMPVMLLLTAGWILRKAVNLL
jgi:hypothetical protein